VIDKMSREQTAAVYTAWLSLVDPRAKDGENPDAFADGRRWGIEHEFDTVLAVVEHFCAWLACGIDAELLLKGGYYDHFRNAMMSEVGDDVEFNCMKAANDDYQRAWVLGVADAFVLMGGDILMDEWKPDRGAMH
jgi:hypothetical protein